MKQKKSFCLLALLLAALLLVGCAEKPAAEAEITPAEEAIVETAAPEVSTEPEPSEIAIVYTNDIHACVYNTVTDEDGNEQPGLRLSHVAAMVNDMRAEGKAVLLVDAGDEFQGSVYGSYDHGSSVVELMNACGYQLACPGNHEFAYGMDNFFALTEQADYPFISCNFIQTETETQVLPSTEILDANGTKIAFVGVSTPDTITSSTPIYFQDADGNYRYHFAGSEDAEALYETVQAAVDSVRDEADYVIILGHLGVGADAARKGISSEALIAHIEGVDAFLDGHSHSTIESSLVADKNGKTVLLTQTGAYLSAVGVLTISTEGEIAAKLVTAYENSDSTVAAMEEALGSEIAAQMGEKAEELSAPLYIFNPDAEEQRFIRAQEMNAGDFVADAFYWFFNEKLQQDCDFVLTNGGGIRCQLEAGDITNSDWVNVCPFGNQLCLIEATGQEILDALEMGASVAGLWDEERNMPAENGGFLHVAGLKYTVDASVESTIVKDDDDNFISVEGAYRVKNVQVFNKTTGTYEGLNLTQTYRVGGLDYILQNSGNGLSMFTDNPLITNFVGQDSMALIQYASAFAGTDGVPVICSANSPLAGLLGYEMDYENPFGAGRITIENSAY